MFIFLQDIVTNLTEKHPVYEGILKMGVSLHGKAKIASDKNQINSEVMDMQQAWDDLHAEMAQK